MSLRDRAGSWLGMASLGPLGLDFEMPLVILDNFVAAALDLSYLIDNLPSHGGFNLSFGYYPSLQVLLRCCTFVMIL